MKENKIKKVSIFGAGYVGCALAGAISCKYQVDLYDTDPKKIDLLKENISPIQDEFFQKTLKINKKNIFPKINSKITLKDCDLCILCLPTNYEDHKKGFDTSILEKEIKRIKNLNNKIPILIKSTVPVGFTDLQNKKFQSSNILFSPEFLREGMALEDNLNPSRIIIGGSKKHRKNLIKFLSSLSKNNPPLIEMESNEAELVKLFSNSYLAMRVAFFNELDSFSFEKGLEMKRIIEGISSDPRIGNYYNNPSFGFGGYCLPKDLKQLSSQLSSDSSHLIKSIDKSNQARFEFISKKIIDLKPSSVGIYRLQMKSASDNFKEAAVIEILKKILKTRIKVYIYEPLIKDKFYMDTEIINNFEDFIKSSDLVIANRIDNKIKKSSTKYFTRDLFGEN